MTSGREPGIGEKLAGLHERGRRQLAKTRAAMDDTRAAVADAHEAMGIEPDEPAPAC